MFLSTSQFGTNGSDEVSGIVTNLDGNVYITGQTEGVLQDVNLGLTDVFIRKYYPSP